MAVKLPKDTIPVQIEVAIKDITPQNRREKLLLATRQIAKTLNIPYEIKKAQRPHGLEPYFYKFQEELADRWSAYYRFILETIYEGLVNALGLPKVEAETVRKVESFSPPTPPPFVPPAVAPVAEPQEDDPILECTFTVKAKRSKLREVKRFLEEGGYEYK